MVYFVQIRKSPVEKQACNWKCLTSTQSWARTWLCTPVMVGGESFFSLHFLPLELSYERSADAQDGWQQNLLHFLLFWLSFVPLNRRYIFKVKHLPPSSGYLGEKILFSGSVSWRNCLYNAQRVLQDLSPSSIRASSLLDAWRSPITNSL